MNLPWQPFRPMDWHGKGSCYPCLIWDKEDNAVFTPCDPWTLRHDPELYAQWACVPTAMLINQQPASKEKPDAR